MFELGKTYRASFDKAAARHREQYPNETEREYKQFLTIMDVFMKTAAGLMGVGVVTVGYFTIKSVIWAIKK